MKVAAGLRLAAAAGRQERSADDRARLRELARLARNATRRVDAALRTGDPPRGWLLARLDEALSATARARNRAALMDLDGEKTAYG